MTPVESAIRHVEFRLSMLPELAAHYGLKADGVALLEQHLLDELGALKALPPGAYPIEFEQINKKGQSVRQEKFSNLLEKAKKL